VLGHGELALQRAERTGALVESAGADAADFDHGYACEAKARALACLGRLDEAGEMYRVASSMQVADQQDRVIYEGDLRAEPWFGLDR
jgi:hypothetical protein